MDSRTLLVLYQEEAIVELLVSAMYVNVYNYLDLINSVASDYCEQQKPEKCDEYFPWSEGI